MLFQANRTLTPPSPPRTHTTTPDAYDHLGKRICEAAGSAAPAGCGCKRWNSRLVPRAGTMKGVCACHMHRERYPCRARVLACHEIRWRALWTRLG